MTATSSGFTSPYWMTYRQALELGGQVRKGEKGAPVIYAGTLIKQDGDPADEAEARTVRFTKGYYVFNANQVDGLPERFHPVTAPPRLDPPLAMHRPMRSLLPPVSSCATAVSRPTMPAKAIISSCRRSRPSRTQWHTTRRSVTNRTLDIA